MSFFGQATQGSAGGFSQPMGGTGLFGQPQQQQPQTTTPFGSFGAQQKPGGFGQSTGTFGGGGLFGQPQSQPNQGFNSSAGAGLFGQSTGGTGSMFGGQPASGGTGGFGVAQPSTGGGLFGQQQPQAQPAGLFGQQQQPTGAFGAQQTQPTGLFGSTTPQPGFGQQTPSTFGGGFGQPQQQPSTGFFGQTQQTSQMGSSGGVFGGGSSLFGGQQQQQPSTGLGMGGGLFGQQQTTQGSGFGGMQQQQQAQPKVGLYQDPMKYPQNIQTNGQALQIKTMQHEDQKGAMQLKLCSCRSIDALASSTFQMIRFIDYQQQKGVQQNSYEWLAMQELQRNPTALKPELQQMHTQLNNTQKTGQQSQQFGANQWGQKSLGSQSPVFGQQPNPSGGLFGQQSTFGQQPQQTQTSTFGAFGQPQQQQQTGLFCAQTGIGAQPQQQTSSLFGGAKPAGSGLFGQQAPGMQSQPAGGLFGQTPQQPAQQIGGGGLFGGAKPAGTGLFGGTPAPATQPAGGLFGAQPAQSQPGQSSLFGGGAQQQTQSTGGLFAQKQGSSFQQPTQAFGTTPAPAAGGLFGGQAKPATGGLFGQTAQPSGGLFGQPAQPQAQPGLFGGAQPAQSSLFGGATAAQPAPGGLFGAQPAQPALGGGLFGSTQQKPGGLFGQPATAQTGGLFGTQPSTGGLFGAGVGGFPQQQPAQPAISQSANLVAHFQNQDPFDMNSGFISKPSPIDNFEKELEKIKKETQNAPNLYEPEKSLAKAGPFNQPLAIDCYAIGVAYEFEKARQMAKQEAKYRAQTQLIKEFQNYSMNESAAKYRDLKGDIGKSQTDSSPLYTSIVGPLHQSKTTRAPPKPDLGKKASTTTKSTSSEATESKDIFTLTVGFKWEEQHENQTMSYPEYIYSFKIHKLQELSKVWDAVISWMHREFNYTESSDRKLKILSNGKVLERSSSTLEAAGIVSNTKLDIVLDDNTPKPETKKPAAVVKEEKEQARDRPASSAREELAPKDKLPKNPMYNMEPDFTSMVRMTLSELKAVPNLRIWNEHGSIQFIGPTDVTEVDFSDVVKIEPNSVEVYDEKRHKDGSYPEVGQKLNKPAIITLQGIKPSPNQTGVDKENKLRERITKQDGEHISYDQEQYAWTFKVKHFTKYGGGDDDEEPSQDSSSNINGRRSDADIKSFADDKEMENELDGGMEIDSVSEISNKNNLYETLQSFKKTIVPTSREDVDFVPTQKQRKVEDQLYESQLIVIPKTHALNVSKESQEASARRARDQAILDKIKRREQQFKDITPVKKSTNAQTTQLLKAMHGQQPKLTNTSLKQGGNVRPCFHPNGSLAFVSGTRVKVLNMQKAVQREDISLLDLLLKHKQEKVELDLPMEHLSISLMKQVRSSEFDNFFTSLLGAPAPSFDLFGETSLGVDCFLHDLAKQLACASATAPEAKKQLRHEFYLVCALNALFGDPTLLLHQYHQDYRGPKTLEKALALNSKLDNFQDLMIQKQRRNCLTELLKFICANEFPVRPMGLGDDQIYGRVKEMILNGDVKGAVGFLQANHKTKIALLLAQCVNTTQTMTKIRELKDHFLAAGKLNKTLAEVLDIITGTTPVVHWQQQLLCELMYEKKTTLQLTDLLNESQIFQFDINDGILTALKVFADINCQHELDGFKFKLTPVSNSFDHRLRWLTATVLIHALNKKTEYNELQGGKKSVNMITLQHLTDISSKYISQLLHANDWKTALAVTMLIPFTHANQRQRLMFEILIRQAPLFSASTIAAFEAKCFVTDTLKLPKSWLATAQALFHQFGAQYEQAVTRWIDATNYNQAHDLTCQQVLPLYMFKSSGVQLLKALTQPSLTVEQRRRLILGQELCKHQARLDEHLLLFEAKRVSGWQSKGGLFADFVRLIQRLAERPVIERPGTVDQQLLTELLKEIIVMRTVVARYYKACFDSSPRAEQILPQFIDLQLLEIEAQLQIMRAQVQPLKQDSITADMISSVVNRPQLNKALMLRNAEEIAISFLTNSQRFK